MAETHHDDPNAAPIHYDVRERFADVHYYVAALLGLAAVAAGIVFGILLAND